MVKRLEKSLSADETSMLKSKITALQSHIIDRELDSIDARISEAQSYLAKYNVSYAQDVKNGRQPTIVQLTSGVENLVRARSIQVGVVKQLETLLAEEMSNISKARLVGFLETAKVALKTMDATLIKRSVYLWTIAVVMMGLLIAGVVFYWKRRSNQVATTVSLKPTNGLPQAFS